MDLTSIKREILEAVLLHTKPVKATIIAKEMGKEFPATMMHLIDLTRKGFTQSPRKGHYLITENGKKAIGLPQPNKETAIKILNQVSRENAFHFYADMGKPLNIYAIGLKDFCEKIEKVDMSSIEFHVKRGDFEAWFKCLGDGELAKKAALIKARKLSGEELQLKLVEIVENQYITLSKMIE
jgi:hypothetical protein